MRRTLGLFALGLSFWFGGCMSTEMPVEPAKEASRASEEGTVQNKDPCKAVIKVVSRLEFSLPFYKKIPQEDIKKDRELITTIDTLCLVSSSNSFIDAEDKFMPIFQIFDRISQPGPKFEFDIISDGGMDYPLLRLYRWGGLYYSPYLLVKNSKLSISTFAHEDGHRKDKHYSKWDYAFDWPSRCRMEAVAISHQNLVSDYFCNVYQLYKIAKNIWDDTRLQDPLIHYLGRFSTFEDFYNSDHGYLKERGFGTRAEHLAGRVIFHILLYKNKGSPNRTFNFLRENDAKTVYAKVYSVLAEKNFIDAIKEGIRMAEARMSLNIPMEDYFPIAIGDSLRKRFLEIK